MSVYTVQKDGNETKYTKCLICKSWDKGNSKFMFKVDSENISASGIYDVCSRCAENMYKVIDFTVETLRKNEANHLMPKDEVEEIENLFDDLVVNGKTKVTISTNEEVKEFLAGQIR